jgi:DNA helicase-2/ATP-dependent DNA helicase PcrA
MTDLLAELNSAQRKAVETIYGPVLVLAGPGTGKTHLLTTRIGHILQQTDTRAQNILCLTFTNAAAVEMRDRLFQKIGKEAHKVTICTFHGFAELVMNEYPLKFETQKAGRELADDLMKALAYRDAVKAKHWKYFRPIYDELANQYDVLSAISNLKREHVSPAQLRDLIPAERKNWEADDKNYYARKYKDFNVGDEKPAEREKLENKLERMQEFSELWEVYEEKLAQRGGYDFDDLINWVTEALERDKNLQFDLQEKYQWILVDEYQDTNTSQNAIVWALTDYEQPNVFVVGDDDQSIYRFQGASTENIRKFREKFPQRTEIALEENYRSGQKILDAAFTVIKNNTDRADENRALLSRGINKEFQENITRVVIGSVSAEQTHLVDQIRTEMKNGTPANEIAVLVRKNREIDELSRILPQFGIPVAASIRGNIFENEYVRQTILLLQIFVAPDLDDLVWEVLHAPYWDIPAGELLKLSMQRERGEHVVEQLFSEFELDHESPKMSSNSTTFLTWLAESRKDFWHCRPEVLTEKILYSSGLLDWLVKEQKTDSLSAVRKFVSWVGEQRCQTIDELLERLDLIQQFNIRVRPDALPADHRSVHLLTAHGAKGREFDVVFIPGLVDKTWGNTRSGNSSVPLPQIFKDSDFDENAEERRLFFVALTRARKKLFLSYATTDNQGRDKNPSLFWHEIPDKLCTNLEADPIEERAQELLPTLLQAGKELHLTNEEETILRERVKGFVWSATALQNYLDCPRRFLFQQLFKFPRNPRPEPQLALGVALHEALEKTLREEITKATLLKHFERALRGQNLTLNNFERLKEHGADILKKNFAEKSTTWMAENVQTELNFGKYNPEIDDIRITGKVDKIVFLDEEKKSARVVDYKSGKPKPIKSGERYWRQLVFYDLLAKAANAPWVVDSCELEFLTPNEKGTLETRVLKVGDEDRQQVRAELKEAHMNVMNLEFPLVENPNGDTDIEFWQNFGK